ncbi:DUF2267 domain-containing protein [Streptomyces shenzhenensis]|uniref:DUF2267 domain-containing protein n=1 Tax=Streptomyces shenzhenensis TaxID=943815 RepID=UPI001F3D8A68|nr:DUF2267 domain-containing protein [Streptomyces shenzhenensis]
MTVTSPQPRATIAAPAPATAPATSPSPAPSPRKVHAVHAVHAVRTGGWQEFTEAVRQAGQYPTRARAEQVTRIVLSALGDHVTGDERPVLTQALPLEAAELIAAQIPAAAPLTARRFVDSVAAHIEGSSPATARWDVSSVLGVLAETVGEPLTTRLLTQLPPGYALLFGRAELARYNLVAPD